MTLDEIQSRLSRIETLWSVVRKAHGSDERSLANAQQQLLDLYGSAIRRYLLASVKNADLADELFQEFAIKFVRGEFKNADPSKGRFRSFVKTVLSRIVALHFRKQKTRKEQSLHEELTGQETASERDDDRAFIQSWREELLSRTWKALSAEEERTGKPWNTILRIRVSDPAASSEELAEAISLATGKSTTAGAARVSVHRARARFAHLLIDVVAESLESPSFEDLEAELIELGLIDYCQDVLTKTKSG